MEVPPGVILRSECVKVLFSSLCRNPGITLLLVTCFLNEGSHFPGFWSLLLHWTVCCYLSSSLIYYLHVASLVWTNSSCIVFHISRDFQSFGKCARTRSLFAIRGTTEGEEFLLSASHSHQKSAMMDVPCPGCTCWVIRYGLACYFYVCIWTA